MRTLVNVGCVALCAIWTLFGNDVYAEDRYRPGDTIIVVTCTNMQVVWDVVGRVHRGYTYEVLQVEGEWLRINNNGRVGWIQSSYVQPYYSSGNRATCGKPSVVRREADVVRISTPIQVEVPQEAVDTENQLTQADQGDSQVTVRFLPPEDTRQRLAFPMQEITVWAKEFQTYRGVTRTEDSITIGGTADGPHGSGGTAWCEVQLPADASNLKLRISLWHGTTSESGKGIHARTRGGRCSVSVNDTTVHVFNCQYNHMHGDWWPNAAAELGHTLPEVDLGAMKASGQSVIIAIHTDPGTCMDLRALNVMPIQR